MLLLDEGLEFRALRTMCDAQKKISSIALSSLDESYFGSEGTKEAFNRVMSFIRTKGKAPKYIDLCSDPSISEDTREELVENKKKKVVKTVEDIKTLIEQLAKYRKARILFYNAENTLNKLQDSKLDIDKLIESNSESIAQSRAHLTLDREPLNIGTGGNSKKLLEEILSNVKADVIPTGFDAFDRKNGGFFRGSLIVIAANTGGGKSTMGNQLMMNMAERGFDATLIPLEMTEKESMGRVLANVSQIPVTKFLFDKLTKKETKKVRKDYIKWQKKLKKNKSRYTIFEPEDDMTVEELLMARHPYGDEVILIDYISLLKGVDGDDSWQQLGKVARFCKVYARTHNIVIVLLAQLSDEGALRYSKAIAEHANNAWFWTYTDENDETGIIDIRQAKARNQRPFPFQLACDFETMRITDVDEELLNQLESEEGNKKRRKLDKFEEDLDSYLLEDVSDED